MNENPATAAKLYELYNEYSKLKNGHLQWDDGEKAAACLFKAAELGYSEAQYELGKAYQNKDVFIGIGAINLEKAVYWYTNAAENGHGYSQWLLGREYAKTLGIVSRDWEKARYWCTKAAENGGGCEDYYELAKIYANGKGGPKDLEKAKHYLTLSAQNFNYNKAKKALAKLDAGATEIKDGGCYVATCVYGSYDCPEVWTLRRYRDGKLSKTLFGRLFIRAYYAVSPRVVKLFGNMKWFNGLCKPVLNKFVRTLQNSGIDNSFYSDM